LGADAEWSTAVIVEYLRYTVPAERAAQFEQAYDQAAEPLLASPHCLGYDVARCSEDPTSYIVRIHWNSSVGHLEGFRKGPEFPRFFALVKPFFEAIVEMRHYEIVSDHPRA
jgi:quinol monooxygenase YgiN